jgi:hypothetical protein
MDGWISIERLFNSFKRRQQALRLDETIAHHRVDVEEIFVVRTFELRKRLRLEIEVMEVDDPFPGNERAPVLHPGKAGTKSAGEASSTLTCRRSLMWGMARRIRSLPGMTAMSMASVLSRQRFRTALAPPVRYMRTASRASAAMARMNARSRGSVTVSRIPSPARS